MNTSATTETTSEEYVKTVEADLAFLKPSEVLFQRDPRGVKHAKRRPIDYPFERQYKHHRCTIHDWSHESQPQPSLKRMGFEAIDLRTLPGLQVLLGEIRESSCLDETQAQALREYLKGTTFPLADGSRLKLLTVANEGIIMRQGGPNGLNPDPDAALSKMNGHGAALSVHGDQDVYGTPIKQMLKGMGPWLFSHRSPDGANRLSPLRLVNVWIPLQQITRPLAFMDRRTLNALEHQIRYGLPTQTFLNRDKKQSLNAVWSFLHDDAQRWYFNAEMDHRQAYVFDTLGTPHGSFILPGEAIAEQYYRQLLERLQRPGSPASSPPPTATLPQDTPQPLRAAITAMAEALQSAPDTLASEQLGRWREQAISAMDRVVRKSIEMRAVAIRLPKFPW